MASSGSRQGPVVGPCVPQWTFVFPRARKFFTTWQNSFLYKRSSIELTHFGLSVIIIHAFHSRIVHLDIIRVLYLPTDAQESCFKKNIKIYIKTSPTCFGLITIIGERIIWAC